MRATLLALGVSLLMAIGGVHAQSQSSSNSSSSHSVIYNTSAIFTTTETTTFTTLTNSVLTTATLSISNGQTVAVPLFSTRSFNETVTATSTLTVTPTATGTPKPAPITLDTVVDPAFAVLGVVLILTGLPSAFWGHKNRWSSFFIIGFYTFSIVCFVLILKYGVLAAVNPPDNVLRGMFVLASTVAGCIGGGIAIFFWQTAKYFIGAWGGFVFGLWIQCFKAGGLITPVGFRWLMYVGCAAVGFVICTIPKLHYPTLLVSTAFVGSTAFVLGIDCFTTAGLKEFYIWNIGFTSLFPKFVNNGIKFPITQTMTIELGLIAAIALMGGAVQLRVLIVLKRKLTEIENDRLRREAELEREHTDRFDQVHKERAEWEKDHPGNDGKHLRLASALSGVPLLGENGEATDGEMPSPAGTPGPFDTPGTMVDGRSSSLLAEDMLNHPPMTHQRSQSSGTLPPLDLGVNIEKDVPKDFISTESPRLLPDSTGLGSRNGKGTNVVNELRQKEELLEEIQSIRRSIDVLRSGSASPGPSSSILLGEGQTRSRYTSFASMDAATQLRAPTSSSGTRSRVHSMNLLNLENSTNSNNTAGASIGRPTSAPLRDSAQAEWDSYVRDRTLFTPPSGATAPIPTSSPAPIAAPSPRRSTFIGVPTAVSDALKKRFTRESVFELGAMGGGDPASTAERGESRGVRTTPDSQLFPRQPPPRSPRDSSPVNILPPQRRNSPSQQQQQQQQQDQDRPRTRTFEELAERHRQKMRTMQAPLTEKEKTRAEIDEARTRYERSREVERKVQAKKEQAQAQEVNRKTTDAKRRSILPGNSNAGGRNEVEETPVRPRPRSRTLSADHLGMGAPPSKRASIMKVEDWQEYQQAQPSSSRRPGGGGGARNDGNGNRSRPDHRRSRSGNAILEASAQVPRNGNGGENRQPRRGNPV